MLTFVAFVIGACVGVVLTIWVGVERLPDGCTKYDSDSDGLSVVCPQREDS